MSSTHEPLLLVSDCASCAGLCCVALPFQRSREFPVDKPAEEPCANLAADARCRIHERLRPAGWIGCTEFECFGAGQRVTQHLFAGASWRDDPSIAGSMFAAFRVMQPVHEMLFHLTQARTAHLPAALRTRVHQLEAELRAVSGQAPEVVAGIDVVAARARVGPVLAEVSAAVRERARAEGRASKHLPRGVGPRAELMGADLAGADLRAADLRGALLIGVRLDAARLEATDVLGADLRDASVRGTDLSGALFLTQPQVNSAAGDQRTRLPAGLTRPSHWD